MSGEKLRHAKNFYFSRSLKHHSRKWTPPSGLEGRSGNFVEAASGFEPLNGGFADLSLNHLGTPPKSESYSSCVSRAPNPIKVWKALTEGAGVPARPGLGRGAA